MSSTRVEREDKLNGSAFDRVDWPWAKSSWTLEIQDETRPLNISREPNDLRGGCMLFSSRATTKRLPRLWFFSFFFFFSEGIKSGSHEKLASGRGLASRGLSEQNSRLRNFSDTTLPCDPGEIRIFAQLRSFWEGEKQGWRLFSLLNPFVSFRSSWASFREFAIVVETRITGANYGSK